MRKAAALAAVAVVAAAAAIAVRQRLREAKRWARVAAVLSDLQERCVAPAARLLQVSDAMDVEMRAGLASEDGSKLKMLVTYVDSLPSGDEKGLFYALDLGGTNFRVLRVQLGGKEQRVIKQESVGVSIPQHLMSRSSHVMIMSICHNVHLSFFANLAYLV